MLRSALLNIMVQTARKAGRGLARDFGEIEYLQGSMKGPGNFATAARHKTEKILIDELSRARPGYCLLSKAGGEIPGHDKSHRWLIDPLDGLFNFQHAFPLFAISIALEREGQLVAGTIYNPVLDELFTAEKGKGVFLNDRRLRVSNRSQLNQSMILCDISHKDQQASPRPDIADIETVSARVPSLRAIGSTALSLAFVASGRADAYILHDPHICDTASGILIIREAGGFVDTPVEENYHGKQQRLIAGNEVMCRNLQQLFQQEQK